MTTLSSAPHISVIVPVRNEAEFIERCVQSLTAAAYPHDKLEIIVVDGMSDDDTAAIVRRIAAADARVRLLENVHRTVPHAMNLGIAASTGDVIVRVDGHACVAEAFLRASVDALHAHGEAWCVGGPIETVSTTPVGRAIATAMSSPVGVGNARFRLGDYEGYVDTIAFGAYRRWVFDKIGLFDEELVRNQDDELNYRLIRAGGRIFMSPAIRSTYYPRTGLRKLWRQYYQYGYWRIRTLQKHGEPATLRQIVPLAFVCGMLVLAAGAVVLAPLRWPLVAFVGLYVIALVAGALDAGRRTRWSVVPLLPVVFAILHFAYGFGSLHGVWSFLVLRRGAASHRPVKLSR